jgi:hypothetical protein
VIYFSYHLPGNFINMKERKLIIRSEQLLSLWPHVHVNVNVNACSAGLVNDMFLRHGAPFSYKPLFGLCLRYPSKYTTWQTRLHCEYSLRPKKLVVLGFKICPNQKACRFTWFGMCACACGHATINEHQIWQINRGNQGHFTSLIICPTISRMTIVLGQRE